MKIALLVLACILAIPAHAVDVGSLGETWALNLRDDGPQSKFSVGITIVEPTEHPSVEDAYLLASQPEVRVTDAGCHVRGAAWDRKPMANVTVELVALHNRRPMANSPTFRARTDGNGIYEVFIPQGRGVYRASAPEWRYASQPEILCRHVHVGVGEVQSVQ